MKSFNSTDFYNIMRFRYMKLHYNIQIRLMLGRKVLLRRHLYIQAAGWQHWLLAVHRRPTAAADQANKKFYPFFHMWELAVNRFHGIPKHLFNLSIRPHIKLLGRPPPPHRHLAWILCILLLCQALARACLCTLDNWPMILEIEWHGLWS